MLGMHSFVDGHSMVQELPVGESYIVTGGAFVKQWQEKETADGILRGHGYCHCDEPEAIRSMTSIFRLAIRCVNSLSLLHELATNYEYPFPEAKEKEVKILLLKGRTLQL